MQAHQSRKKDFQPFYLLDITINWRGESTFSSQLELKINSNYGQNQLCYPFNKNLCLIKLKQVLNSKVHNLGKNSL